MCVFCSINIFHFLLDCLYPFIRWWTGLKLIKELHLLLAFELEVLKIWKWLWTFFVTFGENVQKYFLTTVSYYTTITRVQIFNKPKLLQCFYIYMYETVFYITMGNTRWVPMHRVCFRNTYYRKISFTSNVCKSCSQTI